MNNPSTSLDGVVPVTRYSSAGQRPRDRYAEWREGSLLAFGRLYDTVPVEPFAVDTSLAQLGPLNFAHSRMTAQRWYRTADHIRDDGVDPLVVAVRFVGTGDGNANGRDVIAPPGSIVLSDFAQPFSHDSDTAFTAVLSIPRDIAERTLPAVSSLHGQVISPAGAMLLRSHALTLVGALDAGLPANQAERLGRITLDLLALAVAQTRPQALVTPSAAATGARLAADAAIDRNLASAALTIDNLCRWTGVSRATLYRLFEADGGVRAHIRSRRLARVEEELRRGGKAPLADLAERWGFTDAGHLSRQFRARYGLSPADFRAGHDRPADRPPSAIDKGGRAVGA